MDGACGRFFTMQIDDPANELLRLHGAFLDLSHAVCHGVVLLHHSMVELADRKNSRHQVAEIMNQSVCQGCQSFPPNRIRKAVLGNRLPGNVDQDPVVAQKLLGGGDDRSSYVQQIDDLTGGW